MVYFLLITKLHYFLSNTIRSWRFFAPTLSNSCSVIAGIFSELVTQRARRRNLQQRTFKAFDQTRIIQTYKAAPGNPGFFSMVEQLTNILPSVPYLNFFLLQVTRQGSPDEYSSRHCYEALTID